MLEFMQERKKIAVYNFFREFGNFSNFEVALDRLIDQNRLVTKYEGDTLFLYLGMSQ